MNAFKTRLAAGKPLLGCWLNLASPTAAEALAHAGFDFLVVDTEHSPADSMDLLAMLIAIGSRAAPVVRVTENSPALVKRALDSGCPNLVFPAVDSAAEARAMVANAKWAVVDMTSEFPEVPVLRRGTYLCLPTLDHTAPTPVQIKSALDFIAAEKPFRKVLVHCAAGHGRSATVIAAWLLQNGVVKTAVEANDYMKRIRSGVRLKPAQLRVLDEMFFGK